MVGLKQDENFCKDMLQKNGKEKRKKLTIHEMLNIIIICLRKVEPTVLLLLRLYLSPHIARNAM